MNEPTRPVKGRGTVLSAVAVAAAAVACLFAFAPLASAAETPVATGTTTLTLNGGLNKKLKKSGVKVLGTSPGKVSGKTVTLPVNTVSTFDTASGQGKLLHDGGIKFKKGKKSVKVSEIELITAESKLTAKVGSKAMKFASVTGISATRSGFNTTDAIASIKITGAAAKELNKKLGFSAKKKSNKSSASASKKKKKKKVAAPFKGNQVLGAASTFVEPKAVSVKPTGNAVLNGDLETLAKFELGLGVKITPIAPTVREEPNKFLFPLSGGTIAPSGLAGVPETSGGVLFTQEPPSPPAPPGLIVTLTMGNIWVDLGSKKATAEVAIEDNSDLVKTPGKLGRASIANILLEGATITSDPTARTVTVSNAKAVIDATTAFTLNESFAGGAEVFKEGDALGTFDFTTQTE
jgi:hypothetical protein